MSHIDTLSGRQKLTLASRLTRLVKTEGLVGTMQFLRRWFLYKAHYHLYDKSFEKLEAIPTSRGVRADDLDYDDELRRHSVEYLAAPRMLVHQAIKRMREPLDQFTFIDIGSGLGRPLLVAAEYPFKAVTGYELSPSLHKGAVANIERGKGASNLLESTTSVNANALEAEWPDGPRAFFLFNPFDREFMERFLARVVATAAAGTSHYLLFLNLKHPDLLAQLPFHQCTSSHVSRIIWRLVSPYPLLVYRYDAPLTSSTKSNDRGKL